MRVFSFAISSLLCVLLINHAVSAETLRTQLVLASYRVEHPKTTGTGFLLHRPDPADNSQTQLLLVTAAHVFAGMEGESATLVLRSQDDAGNWQAAPLKIAIRKGEKPLWHAHPKEDVAVLDLKLPEKVTAKSLPLDVLATAEDWNSHAPEPGSLIRCVGFPHAPIFKPNGIGFPTTRLGCIADYPLVPIEKHAKFIVDFNVFEGNSGGAIYSEEFGEEMKIIGLVHGQHFIDERFKTIYSEGLTRKRLGVAIIESSAVILEVIEGMTEKSEDE